MASSVSTQKLPAGLVGVLNCPDDQQDSTYFSPKVLASKHNSTQSSIEAHSNGQRSRANTVSTNDHTPSPVFTAKGSQSIGSPSSVSMSVASIVSPAFQAYSYSAHESDSYTTPPSLNSNVSVLSTNDVPRRESVDSRLGANFGNMRLANSPYASANPSTTSLQSTLAQQRNPTSTLPDLNTGSYRLSKGPHLLYQRLPDPAPITTSRIAPLITGPALGEIARASEPTKGQAWAFPDEPVRRKSSLIPPSDEISALQPNKPYIGSRCSSFTESIASSRYTSESQLPPGQRRFEDGIPSEYSYGSCSEYTVSTHHHTLQHKQISEIQNEADTSSNSQPYTRTPELRISHKLAERKRRLEMKDLFDNLRTLQSVERGAKASKWEILSKAISEHERQAKLIEEQNKAMSRLESQLQRMESELDNARRDFNSVRAENAQLRSEIATLQKSGTKQFQSTSSNPQSYGVNIGEQSFQLPPLRSLQVPEGMNGVQYHHHHH